MSLKEGQIPLAVEGFADNGGKGVATSRWGKKRCFNHPTLAGPEGFDCRPNMVGHGQSLGTKSTVNTLLSTAMREARAVHRWHVWVMSLC